MPSSYTEFVFQWGLGFYKLNNINYKVRKLRSNIESDPKLLGFKKKKRSLWSVPNVEEIEKKQISDCCYSGC